jgi:asparagine synthase (glutamine-hydrolysing)
MCGIAGVIDLYHSNAIAERMLNTMKRRGPDSNGIWETDMCMMLHSRLSIIDPQGGKQPMMLEWAGETYVIVYNGELYNTSEIQNELLGLGHKFATKSDTEVLLHCYIQWGKESLTKINGIFAFAVWHQRERKLFLARDRMGVKPLFYKIHNHGLIFASEMKTVLAYPEVKAELDAQGIEQIVLLGPGRIPGSGVFRNIHELKPGYYAEFLDEKWSEYRYWFLKDREHNESFEETAEHVRFLVLDAIRRQMVSDVPIGTFLSGGLDSSLISAVCAEEMRKNGNTLVTFSVDYQNNQKYFVPGKYQPTSDNTFIEIMHQNIQSRHRETILTPQQLCENLEDSTCARDLPGMADVDTSLLLFCREIRKSVKVALSGECADEIFGGYPWYRDPEVRSKAGFPWAQNISYRTSFLLPNHVKQINPEEFVRSLYSQTINECDILSGTDPINKRTKQMVCLNQKWFMQTLLDRKDRMSMYSGLEVRVPFCDHRIAEYLYGVPWEYKDYNGKEKGLLRYAMEGILPRDVLYRKKSPYPKTHDPQYMNLVSGMMNDLLLEKDAPIYSMVRKEKLQCLTQQDSTWPWYGQLMGIPQTIAYMLQINMWLKMYSVDIL